MSPSLKRFSLALSAGILLIGLIVLCAQKLQQAQQQELDKISQKKKPKNTGHLHMSTIAQQEVQGLVPESELDQLTLHNADRELGFPHILNLPVNFPKIDTPSLALPPPLTLSEKHLPTIQPRLLPNARAIAQARLIPPKMNSLGFEPLKKQTFSAKIYAFSQGRAFPLQADHSQVLSLCPKEQFPQVTSFTLVHAERSERIWQVALQTSCGHMKLDAYALRLVYAALLRADLEAELSGAALPHAAKSRLRIDIEWRPLLKAE